MIATVQYTNAMVSVCMKDRSVLRRNSLILKQRLLPFHFAWGFVQYEDTFLADTCTRGVRAVNPVWSIRFHFALLCFLLLPPPHNPRRGTVRMPRNSASPPLYAQPFIYILRFLFSAALLQSFRTLTWPILYCTHCTALHCTGTTLYCTYCTTGLYTNTVQYRGTVSVSTVMYLLVQYFCIRHGFLSSLSIFLLFRPLCFYLSTLSWVLYFHFSPLIAWSLSRFSLHLWLSWLVRAGCVSARFFSFSLPLTLVHTHLCAARACVSPNHIYGRSSNSPLCNLFFQSY